MKIAWKIIGAGQISFKNTSFRAACYRRHGSSTVKPQRLGSNLCPVNSLAEATRAHLKYGTGVFETHGLQSKRSDSMNGSKECGSITSLIVRPALRLAP